MEATLSSLKLEQRANSQELVEKRALPLPCIILNANRRTKNGGSLGTRLLRNIQIRKSQRAESGQDNANVNYSHACVLAAKSCWSDAPQMRCKFFFAVDIGLDDQAASCRSNKWSQIVGDKSLIQQVIIFLDSNKNVPGKTDKS